MENEMLKSFRYAGNIVDPRRRQERADFNLIREDKTAMSNLPKTAQHHEIPLAGGLFWPIFE